MQQKYHSVFNTSFPRCSHVGVFFANEDQKKGWLGKCLILLPCIPAFQTPIFTKQDQKWTEKLPLGIFFEYIPLILTGLMMLLHSESPAIQAHVQHSIVTVSVKGKHARESYWPWVQFSFVLPFLSLPAQVGSAPLPSSSVHTPASAAATPVKPMLVGQLQRLDQWESLLQTERQLGTQMVASRRGQKNSNKLQIG